MSAYSRDPKAPTPSAPAKGAAPGAEAPIAVDGFQQVLEMLRIADPGLPRITLAPPGRARFAACPPTARRPGTLAI